MKKCTKCNKTKPISEFSKNKSRKDGLDNHCKECRKIYRKRWYEENKEERRLSFRKWYKENPEKVRIRNRKWHKENEKEVKIKKRKYYEKNPKRFWAASTLNSHRRGGYQIKITINELTEIAKQISNCPICGCDLGWKRGKGKAQPNSPSLDRINNGQIVSKNTTQIICLSCNTKKGTSTMTEFIEYCHKIADKFKRINNGRHTK